MDCTTPAALPRELFGTKVLASQRLWSVGDAEQHVYTTDRGDKAPLTVVMILKNTESKHNDQFLLPRESSARLWRDNSFFSELVLRRSRPCVEASTAATGAR